jgi:hypothetical protein
MSHAHDFLLGTEEKKYAPRRAKLNFLFFGAQLGTALT